MKQDKKTEEFYERLLKQLEEDTTWPSPYLFKFIVSAENEKIAEIRSIFDDVDADIITRDSSKGTYTSVSVRVTLDSPQHVVKKYIEVSSVEGVISL
jgi:putative lipoic acid-binding regulatory protein